MTDTNTTTRTPRAPRAVRYTMHRRSVRLVPTVGRTAYTEARPNGVTEYVTATRGEIADSYRVEVLALISQEWGVAGIVTEPVSATGAWDALVDDASMTFAARRTRKAAAVVLVDRHLCIR